MKPRNRLTGSADEHMQELAFSISTSGSYTAQRHTSSAMSACRKQRDGTTRSASTDLTVGGRDEQAASDFVGDA